MDFEVYKGIINSLADFPDPVRVIRLYKEGEPLLKQAIDRAKNWDDLFAIALSTLVNRFINNRTINHFYDTKNSSKDGGVVSWAGKQVSST